MPAGGEPGFFFMNFFSVHYTLGDQIQPGAGVWGNFHNLVFDSHASIHLYVPCYCLYIQREMQRLDSWIFFVEAKSRSLRFDRHKPMSFFLCVICRNRKLPCRERLDAECCIECHCRECDISVEKLEQLAEDFHLEKLRT